MHYAIVMKRGVAAGTRIDREKKKREQRGGARAVWTPLAAKRRQQQQRRCTRVNQTCCYVCVYRDRESFVNEKKNIPASRKLR